MSEFPTPDTSRHEYRSNSARKCHLALVEWSQDARLYSEAIVRLTNQVSESPGSVSISREAWPLGKTNNFPLLRDVDEQRLKLLLQKSWRSQFILLEGIWEIYLEMLYLELSIKLPHALEDLCKQSPPEFLLRAILSETQSPLDDIRNRTAEWLASKLTRKSWTEQWDELQRLKIGLTEKHKKERWWQKLDIYFEMRNCLVHRNGRPSNQLLKKDLELQNQLDGSGNIRLSPSQLEFFWIQFRNVIIVIDKALDGCIRARS